MNIPKALPCGILSFADDGIIHFVNEILLQKLEYSLNELTGGHIQTLLPVAGKIFYQTHLYPLLKLQGEANEIFLMLRSKTKKDVPVLLNAIQTNEAGIITNTFACIFVYQRRMYEDEILRAKKIAEDAMLQNKELQQLKDDLEKESRKLDKEVKQLQITNQELFQLNGLITHDLQEPVRKILLFGKRILELEANLQDRSANALSVVLHAGTKMQSLLFYLQEYMEISVREIEYKPVPLSTILSEQIQSITAKYPNIVIETDLTELPIIPGNSNQLKQLFKELLHNAGKFQKDDVPLSLHINTTIVEENLYSSTQNKYAYGKFVCISFADNGIGFNASYKDYVFGIMKKLSATSSGLGFGLALSKRIVEKHKGTINVISAEGKGSTFTVCLPLQ